MRIVFCNLSPKPKFGNSRRGRVQTKKFMFLNKKFNQKTNKKEAKIENKILQTVQIESKQDRRKGRHRQMQRDRKKDKGTNNDRECAREVTRRLLTSYSSWKKSKRSRAQVPAAHVSITQYCAGRMPLMVFRCYGIW